MKICQAGNGYLGIERLVTAFDLVDREGIFVTTRDGRFVCPESVAHRSDGGGYRAKK
jgi:hypothetical protein